MSFLAELLVDKFLYHLPLYRQHQRLTDFGIRVSRGWLTQLVHRTAALLAPIYEAQRASILDSAVIAMDETPIKVGLREFLAEPDVPIDTNHLERALRPIPMGRKNWLFCWSEVGAKYVGIIQSLLVTCRLHQIAPYDYLVDVLQRIDTHPASHRQPCSRRGCGRNTSLAARCVHRSTSAVNNAAE